VCTGRTVTPPRGRGLEEHCGGGSAQVLVGRAGLIRREAVRLRTGNGLGEAVVGRPAVASLRWV